MLNLPTSALVDRFVSKAKFYERVQIPTAVRDEFTNIIDRITWLHKLSEETVNIPATDAVQEIQVFQIDLKQKEVPQKALSVIDKTIPYPILFILKYEDVIRFVIQHKLDASRRYYKTEWGQIPSLPMNGANLEVIYERIIASFILVDNEDRGVGSESMRFEELVAVNTRREQLQKEITALESKIRGERQFSRKVELNGELQRVQGQLSNLT